MMAIEVRGLTPLVQVYDMPASVRFYRDLLGFEIVSTSPVLGKDRFHWVLLRLGKAELMLNTAYEFDHERPVPADRVRAATHEDITLYFGCPDVDAAYEELHEKGVALKPPQAAPYGMKQLSLRDPDGYGLCFQWPADE
jgi:catechol 2,3-dioxygenase-like lactoylglutathione lyase family enzyme